MPLASFDGECNLNDSGEFSKSFHIIYLNELQINFKHHGLYISFPNLDITIVDDIYQYKRFGKRNDYLFTVPNLSGNTPAYVFYGSISSKFLKIKMLLFKIL